MGCRRVIVISVWICLVASFVTSAEDFKFPSQFGDFNNGRNDDGMEQYIGGGMDDNSFGLADDQLIQNNKRMPSFSVNGGLRSLTDMLYSRERANMASGRSGIRNRLLKLGKRDWKDETSDDTDSNRLPLLELNKRRSQQLSVSGPLSALANMLAAEGRHRQFTESRHNRMRLLELGKRSDDLSRLGQYSDSSDDAVDLF